MRLDVATTLFTPQGLHGGQRLELPTIGSWPKPAGMGNPTSSSGSDGSDGEGASADGPVSSGLLRCARNEVQKSALSGSQEGTQMEAGSDGPKSRWQPITLPLCSTLPKGMPNSLPAGTVNSCGSRLHLPLLLHVPHRPQPSPARPDTISMMKPSDLRQNI